MPDSQSLSDCYTCTLLSQSIEGTHTHPFDDLANAELRERKLRERKLRPRRSKALWAMVKRAKEAS